MEIDQVLNRLIAADVEYKAAMKAAQEHGGSLVLQARKSLGLTQRDLADKLGLNFTYISKIENGHIAASKKVLTGIAETLRGENNDTEAV
jgi:ribosome-binding protein aMBF1 (putative translation factor)